MIFVGYFITAAEMLLAHSVQSIGHEQNISSLCLATNMLHVISFERKNNCKLGPTSIILMSEATFIYFIVVVINPC